jgi:crotonobetainyl-CoA:carnitine CoA-transferase CaiB-like acyl-CoA transferase
LRVLDFSHALAGPLCSMILADLGAEVIKIEHPRRGDGSRHMGKPLLSELQSDYFLAFNRNKLSVGLDIKNPEGRTIALDLARQSDVVVENFRPGVMDRLGLGYDAVKAANPDAIYLSISGFGATGPLSQRGANDITVQAYAGLMSTTGEAGGDPLKIGIPIVDIGTGLYGTIATLAALRQRDSGAGGQHIELSMLSTAVSLLGNYIPAVVMGGETVEPLGTGHHQLVPYQGFRSADGQTLIVGAFTQSFWRALCEILDVPSLISDDRYLTNAARVRNKDTLIPVLQERFLTMPRDHWVQLLDKAGVPCAPTNTIEQALREEQVGLEQCLVEIPTEDGPVVVAASPLRLDSTALASPSTPPKIGSSSYEVLKRHLGLSDAKLSELQGSGVISIPSDQ